MSITSLSLSDKKKVKMFDENNNYQNLIFEKKATIQRNSDFFVYYEKILKIFFLLCKTIAVFSGN